MAVAWPCFGSIYVFLSASAALCSRDRVGSRDRTVPWLNHFLTLRWFNR